MSIARCRPLFVLLAIVLTAAACGSSEITTADEAVTESSEDSENSGGTEASDDTGASDTGTSDDNGDAAETDNTVGDAAAAGAAGVDPDLFMDGALAEDVTIEDCTLDGGAETTCYRITVAGYPVSHDVGPFCPESIDDGADAGGIWFDGTAVYDIDGQFIVDLPEIYGDDQWQMYDEDGNVFVTDTEEAFDGAARPDVEPEFQNHCVEGRLEWLDGGEPITTTVMIPVTPIAASQAAVPRGTQGVTLDGVVIAASAPVSAILGAYTIAAFDDCGGHFNPADGYHMHGAVGCSESGTAADGETPIFGYAMDGYAVHSPLDSDDLDVCNGHTTEADGYHYHANSAEKNQVVACLIGQSVASAGGPRG